MTFDYQMKANSMDDTSRSGITGAVNTAIAELDGGKIEKMSALELVAWINKWYKTATYKHLIVALRAFVASKAS